MLDRRFLLLLAASGLTLAASGCQSGGGGFLGMGERRNPVAAEEPTRLTDEQLRAYCPRVTLPERAAILSRYQSGGDGDPTKLTVQASISDVTRACTYADGMLTLNVAAAGRVVPGPAASTGTVTLPVVIRVVEGEAEVYSRTFQQAVTIASLTTPTQFVVNEPAIVIRQPTARNVQIFVGFDVPPEPRRDDDFGL